jgi:copper chaperone
VAVDSTATVQADLKTKQVKLETQASKAAIKNAVEMASYPVA